MFSHLYQFAQSIGIDADAAVLAYERIRTPVVVTLDDNGGFTLSIDEHTYWLPTSPYNSAAASPGLFRLGADTVHRVVPSKKSKKLDGEKQKLFVELLSDAKDKVGGPAIERLLTWANSVQQLESPVNIRFWELFGALGKNAEMKAVVFRYHGKVIFSLPSLTGVPNSGLHAWWRKKIIELYEKFVFQNRKTRLLTTCSISGNEDIIMPILPKIEVLSRLTSGRPSLWGSNKDSMNWPGRKDSEGNAIGIRTARPIAKVLSLLMKNQLVPTLCEMNGLETNNTSYNRTCWAESYPDKAEYHVWFDINGVSPVMQEVSMLTERNDEQGYEIEESIRSFQESIFPLNASRRELYKATKDRVSGEVEQSDSQFFFSTFTEIQGSLSPTSYRIAPAKQVDAAIRKWFHDLRVYCHWKKKEIDHFTFRELRNAALRKNEYKGVNANFGGISLSLFYNAVFDNSALPDYYINRLIERQLLSMRTMGDIRTERFAVMALQARRTGNKLDEKFRCEDAPNPNEYWIGALYGAANRIYSKSRSSAKDDFHIKFLDIMLRSPCQGLVELMNSLTIYLPKGNNFGFWMRALGRIAANINGDKLAAPLSTTKSRLWFLIGWRASMLNSWFDTAPENGTADPLGRILGFHYCHYLRFRDLSPMADNFLKRHTIPFFTNPRRELQQIDQNFMHYDKKLNPSFHYGNVSKRRPSPAQRELENLCLLAAQKAGTDGWLPPEALTPVAKGQIVHGMFYQFLRSRITAQ